MTTEPIHPPKAVFEHASADTPVLRFSGTWRIGEQIPTARSWRPTSSTVGKLLIDQLIKAADRGVRVRMLIDDIYGNVYGPPWMPNQKFITALTTDKRKRNHGYQFFTLFLKLERN
jgi:hypothetical protein